MGGKSGGWYVAVGMKGSNGPFPNNIASECVESSGKSLFQLLMPYGLDADKESGFDKMLCYVIK